MKPCLAVSIALLALAVPGNRVLRRAGAVGHGHENNHAKQRRRVVDVARGHVHRRLDFLVQSELGAHERTLRLELVGLAGSAAAKPVPGRNQQRGSHEAATVPVLCREHCAADLLSQGRLSCES